MTDHVRIAARLPRCRFIADGAQLAFAFDFAVFRAEDIQVRVAGAPVEDGYAVSIGPAGTGAVTFAVAPPAGASVVLRRQLAIRRETDFQEGGELRAKTLNDELDFQTAALQQVETAVARAIHLSDDDADDAPSGLPPAAARARKALVFDAAGNPAVSADDYADQAAVAGTHAQAAAASAAAAGVSAVTAADAGTACAELAAIAGGHALGASAASASAATYAADAAAAASALAIAWTVDGATAMEDPGTGAIRFDAPAPGDATAIAVSAHSMDADVSAFVATWAASTNPDAKGTLMLRKRGDGAAFAAFTVRAVADLGTWLRIDVTPAGAAGGFAAGDFVRLAFARAGDRGTDGLGTIVSLAAADGSIAVGGTPTDRTVGVPPNALTPAKFARLGAAGQVLTSNGAAADATFQALPAGVPAGVVVPFAGPVEPEGWLFAAGQAVNRAVYAALFAALGTLYGAGDGATTFNLPDLRGRVAAGRDDMKGAAAGRLTAGGSGMAGATLGAAGGGETHVLTVGQMPAHTHSQSGLTGGPNHALATNYPDGPYNVGGSTGSAGGGQAHPNVQPTLVLNYVIKT